MMKMCPRWLLIVWLVGSLGHYLFGQATYLDEPIISEREFRVREAEQRALDLSKRLSEITGTDPIELIDRNRSLAPIRYEGAAQRAFDVLPGPLHEADPEVDLPDLKEEEQEVVTLIWPVPPGRRPRICLNLPTLCTGSTLVFDHLASLPS